MKHNVKIKRSIREIESFTENDVFYSFKYEYTELFGESQKFFELKTDITVLVENAEKKRLYFNFKPDLGDTTSYGKLSVVAREHVENPHRMNKDSELIKVNFTSLSESTEFSNILTRVHAECVKIISSKFKDIVASNDAKEFFSK